MQALQPDTLIHNPQGCEVVARVDIAAGAQQVWTIVGNFAGFAQFIPALAHIDMTGSGVGSVRRKLFKDGNVVIEQLNSRDEQARRMTWSLIHTSLPIGNLWAAMEVFELGEGESQAVWTIRAEETDEAFLKGFADQAMGNVRAMFG